MFVSLSQGSFGPQAGFESSDLILVFQDRDQLDKVAHGKDVTLGVDADVTAGTVGKTAAADTRHDKVLAYSHFSGLFAGAILYGSILAIEKDVTNAYSGFSEGEEGVRVYRNDEQGLYNHIIGHEAMKSPVPCR